MLTLSEVDSANALVRPITLLEVGSAAGAHPVRTRAAAATAATAALRNDLNN